MIMKKHYIIPEMASVELVTLSALCNVSGGGFGGVGDDGDGSGDAALAPYRGGYLLP